MSIICPTVLASEPHEFREQILRIEPFSERIQIDLMDGEFAPSKSISPIQVWWPDHITADIHLMFQRPSEHLETLVSLNPHMVIVHAESDGDTMGILRHFQQCGIKAGVALLKNSKVADFESLIAMSDHVLLFSGELGHFGGVADLNVLQKVLQIKHINQDIEIGWDGGANAETIAALVRGGIDVINVGSGIQRSQNPQDAYDKMKNIIETA